MSNHQYPVTKNVPQFPWWTLIMAACTCFLSVCSAGEEDTCTQARHRMIEHDLKGRGISEARVLAAMERVPRHLFVPEELCGSAYADHPLPIGQGQTISQPYIVAFMTQALKLSAKDRVLEIGTGSGYQAAVLAELVDHVYTIEFNKLLADSAEKLLRSLGYSNITVRHGDGFFGWNEFAPFDAVIITCAADNIPAPLVAQLAEGGRIVLPRGNPARSQHLVLGTKKNSRLSVAELLPVRFVPMRGEAETK